MTKVTLRYYFKYDNYHKKITFLLVNSVCDKSHRKKDAGILVTIKHKKTTRKTNGLNFWTLLFY
jgi:hypothetical protein